MYFRKTYLISTLFLFISTFLSGQIQRNTGQITGGTYSGSTIEAFSSVPESFPNDNYLYAEWYYGSINLKGSDKVDVKEIPIKINVVRNTLEFRHQNVVKEIDIKAINSLKLLIPNQLQPAEFISMESEGGLKVFKINHIGDKYSSFVHFTYQVIPADYNAQFDTGSKTDRVKIDPNYYLKEGEGPLTKVKLNKKGIRNYFEERSPAAYDYIKKNKPQLDTEYDLSQLMIKLNELL
ncbi:hypothetical protein SAMN05421640_2502 [Ekhidna lutea]|uniref:Uncharacterized protein n=1 Tax=Ekhidna lutea TaxID=447679 RepID=A0A239K7X1_EKHLU|nr:hypothetical protein [Ekhidna lutea]SNT14566.1 hypothetical protein SAMN05421640_2502 [Ekhidna lutea]